MNYFIGVKMANKLSFTVLAILLTLLSASSVVHASKKQDKIMALKASEELAVLSQSVVKDYFYIAKGLNSIQARAQMKKYQAKIDEHVAFLSGSVKDPAVTGMLQFMDITREEMRTMLNEPYSQDNAYLIMDMSEVILEGAESISTQLQKSMRGDHRMLDLVEHQLYLIERMNKLYIAAKSGMYDYNSKQQMQQAIKDFESGLRQLRSYNYPPKHMTKVEKIKKHWNASRGFYEKVETASVPRTVFLATELMGYPLRKLADYHVAAN